MAFVRKNVQYAEEYSRDLANPYTYGTFLPHAGYLKQIDIQNVLWDDPFQPDVFSYECLGFGQIGDRVLAVPYYTGTQITIVAQQYDPATGEYSEGVEIPNGSKVSRWPAKLTITCVTGDMTVVYTVVVMVDEPI